MGELPTRRLKALRMLSFHMSRPFQFPVFLFEVKSKLHNIFVIAGHDALCCFCGERAIGGE